VAVLVGPHAAVTRLAVAYTLVSLPVVYAHQYLNERLSGGFVVAMALAPLLVLVWPSRGRHSHVQIKEDFAG
jgi:hypothetical protein